MYKVSATTQQFVSALRVFIHARIESERGATAVEYGLLVALIAIVAAVGIAVLGTNLSGLFSGASTEVG